MELDAVGQALPATERGLALARSKTRASREITVKLKPNKLLIPAAVVLVVVAAIVVILSVSPGREAVPPPLGKPSLAILYFENMSGDPSLDIWRTGLHGIADHEALSIEVHPGSGRAIPSTAS